MVTLEEKVDKKMGYFGKRFKASSTNFSCASVGGFAASFRNASASLPFKVGGGFGSIFLSSVICISCGHGNHIGVVDFF